MKHIKIFKLFENKEETKKEISKLFSDETNLSKEDIVDIFLEVTDYGYEFSTEYCILDSDEGKIKRWMYGIPNYHPTLVIKLIREKKGNYINYDGGLYYEGDGDVVTMINDSFFRLKQTIGEKGKVLICFRSINDISIRIVLPEVRKERVIPIDRIYNIMNESRDNLIHKYDNRFNDDENSNLKKAYKVQMSGGFSKDINFSIVAQKPYNHKINIEKPEFPIDFISKDLIDKNQKRDINNINFIIDEFLNIVKKNIKDNLKLDIIFKKSKNGQVQKIDLIINKKNILTIYCSYEPYDNLEIKVGYSFFRSGEIKKINFHKAEINIILNKWKKS